MLLFDRLQRCIELFHHFRGQYILARLLDEALQAHGGHYFLQIGVAAGAFGNDPTAARGLDHQRPNNFGGGQQSSFGARWLSSRSSLIPLTLLSLLWPQQTILNWL